MATPTAGGKDLKPAWVVLLFLLFRIPSLHAENSVQSRQLRLQLMMWQTAETATIFHHSPGYAPSHFDFAFLSNRKRSLFQHPLNLGQPRDFCQENGERYNSVEVPSLDFRRLYFLPSLPWEPYPAAID